LTPVNAEIDWNFANRARVCNAHLCEGGVTADMAIMEATDTITVVEGYDAMRIFLETVSRRHGKTDEEIEFIIGGLKWADGSPVDPTMWRDWLAAVQVICSCRKR
jgi:hypothetical protein